MSALTRLFVSSFHQRAIDEVNNLSSPVRNPRNSHNKSILRLVSTAAEMLLLEARQLSTQSTSCLPSDVPSHCCFKGRPIFCLFCKKNAPCLSIWKFWFLQLHKYILTKPFLSILSPHMWIYFEYIRKVFQSRSVTAPCEGWQLDHAHGPGWLLV